MKQQKNNPVKKTKKLSAKDLRNLMDINRPIYKRAKGGAFRQR